MASQSIMLETYPKASNKKRPRRVWFGLSVQLSVDHTIQNKNNKNQGYTPEACEVIDTSLWPNHYTLRCQDPEMNPVMNNTAAELSVKLARGNNNLLVPILVWPARLL